MPKLLIDYSHTVFYKIVSTNLDIEIYVGHTIDFKRRKSEHKRRCNSENDKYHNSHVYSLIRANGGWSSFDMVLIDQRSCQNRLEAEQVERSYIETLHATLNKVIPTRSDKEYRSDNKVGIAEKAKQYRESCTEQISEKRKIHRAEHKEAYTLRSKKYYELNKEKILKQQKQRHSAKRRVKINTETTSIEDEIA